MNSMSVGWPEAGTPVEDLDPDTPVGAVTAAGLAALGFQADPTDPEETVNRLLRLSHYELLALHGAHREGRAPLEPWAHQLLWRLIDLENAMGALDADLAELSAALADRGDVLDRSRDLLDHLLQAWTNLSHALPRPAIQSAVSQWGAVEDALTALSLAAGEKPRC